MRESDELVIARLFIAQGRKLYNHAYALLGSGVLAEDAVQETFKVAIERIDVVAGHEVPEAWLMQTLNYICRNMKRAENKQGKIKEIDQPSDVCRIDTIGVLPTDMNPVDERLLLLACVERLPMREVAEQIERPKWWCDKRLKKLKCEMKSFLLEEEKKHGQ